MCVNTRRIKQIVPVLSIPLRPKPRTLFVDKQAVRFFNGSFQTLQTCGKQMLCVCLEDVKSWNKSTASSFESYAWNWTLAILKLAHRRQRRQTKPKNRRKSILMIVADVYTFYRLLRQLRQTFLLQFNRTTLSFPFTDSFLSKTNRCSDWVRSVECACDIVVSVGSFAWLRMNAKLYGRRAHLISGLEQASKCPLAR